MSPADAPTRPLPALAGERFNFAGHVLALNAGRADKPAYIDDHGVLTYAELAARVRRLAAALRASGLRREERVLLLMHDCADWPVCFLAALHAGVVPVAVNTLLTADDYAYMLQHSRAQAVLVSAALLPVLRQARGQLAPLGLDEVQTVFVAGAGTGTSLQQATAGAALQHEQPVGTVSNPPVPDGVLLSEAADAAFVSPAVDAARGAPVAGAAVNSQATGAGWGTVALDAVIHRHAPQLRAAATTPDEPAFWLYSSGSTGRPKGTVHTHGNLAQTAELYGRAVLGIVESDICFSAAKLFFAYGLGNALTFPLSVGATVVLMAERPTPDAVFKRWIAHRPTVFFGAPTGFAGMLASPNLPAREQIALRLASSAGEALPAELGQRFSAHYGVDIVDGIGSTEMLHIFISNLPGKVRYGTTGWPVPGYAIELRADDGSPLPLHADGSTDTGDLYIRGPSAALMYWGNREKTRDTFQGGWTKSGDKYQRNADGSYTYAGRSDDMLKVSGIYVSPFEVEATLVQHPAVLEAAVIGVCDVEGLTRSKAFVVLKAGAAADEAELKAFVKDRLAPYKYPRAIAFVAELPKTATGKIQRFKLREQEQGQEIGARP